jgi:hypothetical protein
MSKKSRGSMVQKIIKIKIKDSKRKRSFPGKILLKMVKVEKKEKIISR